MSTTAEDENGAGCGNLATNLAWLGLRVAMLGRAQTNYTSVDCPKAPSRAHDLCVCRSIWVGWPIERQTKKKKKKKKTFGT